MNTVRIVPEQIDHSTEGAFSDFIDLASVIDFLKRYAMSILIATALGIMAATIFILTSEDLYTAKTEILIEPKLHQLQQQVSDVNLSLDTPQLESQIAMLQSEKIAAMVVDELNLMEDEEFLQSANTSFVARAEKLVKFVRGQFLAPSGARATGPSTEPAETETTSTESEESAQAAPGTSAPAVPEALETAITEYERYRSTVELLGRRLTVRRKGVSYAIEISYIAHDPELAADVTNAVAQSYLREQIENKSRGAKEGSLWLESRLQELRSQMNLATQAAQAFRARHDYRIGTTSGEAGATGEASDPSATLQDRLKGPTLEELEITADTYRKIYESVLQAYMSSVSQQSYPAADARVITPASPPLYSSYPKSKLLLVFGAFGGLMLGVAAAFGRQMLDDRVRTPQQLWEEIGLNCLGELPRPPQQWAGKPRFDLVSKYPRSQYVRSLMSIGTTLRLLEINKPLRCIGITSCEPGNRKGELACHLAAMYERKGVRTLVVNADPGHSALTRGLPTSFAAKTAPEAETKPSRDIRAVDDQSFDYLPAGTTLHAQLTSREESEELLGCLQAYKIIIIELPPVGPGAEEFPMEWMLDGIVVVAEYGRSRVDAMADALNSLLASGVPILGAVLSDVRVRSRKTYNRLPVSVAKNLRG